MLHAFSYALRAVGRHYPSPGLGHLAPDHACIQEDLQDDRTSSTDWLDMLGIRDFTLQHVQALLPASNTLEILCVSAYYDGCGPSSQGLHTLTAFQNL